MTPLEEARLDFLRSGGCSTLEYFGNYYGLRWPFEGELLGSFSIWRDKIPTAAPCPAGMASRYELEAFMQQRRIMPAKWMAAKLGMTEKSFAELSSLLEDLGLHRERYLPYSQMASTSLTDDIVPALPSLRFRTFSDHNSFCRRLHEALIATLPGLVIDPLFCATSTRLQDCPPQYALHFDCLTLQPLCTRHATWLDFHKPLVLGPDRCSKLFYAENQERLRPLCAGAGEPDHLEDYQEFLAGHHNG